MVLIIYILFVDNGLGDKFILSYLSLSLIVGAHNKERATPVARACHRIFTAH